MKSAALLFVIAWSVAAEPIAPVRVQIALGSLARDLAAKGAARESAQLRELLLELGQTKRDADQLAKSCEKKLAKAKIKTGAAKFAPELKKLDRVIDQLVRMLETVPKGSRNKLAQSIIRLDSDNAKARDALGHVRVKAMWVAPAHRALQDRRVAIANALQRAGTLKVEVERVNAGHERMKRIEGSAGIGARGPGLVVYSNVLSYSRMERLVREVVRALALSRFLRGEPLQIPDVSYEYECFVFRTRKHWDLFIDEAYPDESTPAVFKKAVRGFGYCRFDRGRRVAFRLHGDEVLRPGLWYVLFAHDAWVRYGAAVQPCLLLGHTHWVAQRYLKFAMPRHASLGGRDRGKEGLTTARIKEREWFVHIGDAGAYGGRVLMQNLVANGEDPPWRESMMDKIANIRGFSQLKSMFVVEYLQEAGRLDSVLRRSAGRERVPATAMRETLDQPFGQFETSWRSWFLAGGAQSGLLQRLRTADGRTRAAERASSRVVVRLDGIERSVLDHLNALRGRVFPERAKLIFDRVLSDGAVSHCGYLKLNPDMARSWPEVHEEDPNRSGYSLAGHRAGQHSVIISGAPSGTRSGVAAVDGWMGTVYHRFPLLHPGLTGIGWGSAHGFSMIDSRSLVKPVSQPQWVGWPPANSRDIPRAFASGERPHPVPGEDQSQWGYPITVQLFGYEQTSPVEMELIGPKKRPVPCHYSTPDKPTNPEVVPAGCYFLIPKQSLKSKTTYRVVVRKLPDGSNPSWTFRTR